MNQDTVAASMAKKLGQSKGEFLLESTGSMAVKVAKSETIIVKETKEWLKEQKIVDLEALDKLPRDANIRRSDTILLIKNLPATAKEAEVKEIFERYGSLERFIVSPFNTLAIAEYSKSGQAAVAMKNLAYHKVNYVTPIYLEYSPLGFFVDKKKAAAAKVEYLESCSSESEDSEKEVDEKEKQQRQIFVKNLNFDTTEAQLEIVFKEAKISGKVKSVKIVRRADNQQSRGYGFIEVDSKACAEKAVKKLQNFLLDEHALKLSLSTKRVTETEEAQKKQKVLKKRTGKEQSKISGEQGIVEST